MYPEKPLSSYHGEKDPHNLSRMRIPIEARLKRHVSVLVGETANMRIHLIYAVTLGGTCQSAVGKRR